VILPQGIAQRFAFVAASLHDLLQLLPLLAAQAELVGHPLHVTAAARRFVGCGCGRQGGEQQRRCGYGP